MSPIVPIVLGLLASVFVGAAVFLDFYGHGRQGAVVGLFALVVFVSMVVTLGDVSWSDTPDYDPQTCVDLAWLDGRWACIPRDDAG